MNYRNSHSTDHSLQDALKLVETILRKRGEIELSTIQSIPSVRTPRDVQAILGNLQSKFPISITRRVEQTSPMLRWESIVAIRNDRRVGTKT